MSNRPIFSHAHRGNLRADVRMSKAVCDLARQTQQLSPSARVAYMAEALRAGQQYRNHMIPLTPQIVVTYALLLCAGWTVASVDELLRGMHTVEELRLLIVTPLVAADPLDIALVKIIEPTIMIHIMPIVKVLDAATADRVDLEIETAWSSF